MLTNLHVKNLALIDEIEVDFKHGLNILTGETGAGKSIIIDSISFALGEKVPKNFLRDNEEAGLVELVFSDFDERTNKMLQALHVDLEEDLVILSRKITGGRSVAKVNGESVPVSRLKEVASVLIDIHGQHEHQSLLHKYMHLAYLDEYAKESLSGDFEQLRAQFNIYKECKKKLEEAASDTAEREREASFLEYECKEIEDAKLFIGEDEALEAEHKRFANGKKIMEALSTVDHLMGTENGMGDAVGRSVRELSLVCEYDEELNGLYEQGTQIDQLLSDFSRELRSYMDNMEFDKERLYEIEKRLDVLNHLKSKYGGSIEAVLEQLEKKQERLDVLANYEAYVADLEQSYEAAAAAVERLSEQISAKRKAAAEVMTAKMVEALQDLNFLDVQFSIHFDKTDGYSAIGYDDVEYMISTNPGEPLKRLADVASGGELSRIMLALKSVLAEHDNVGTLIFDEIDTGISGRTAQMVSEKMHGIGRKHQVICITHLPQIAAMADAHFLIEKNVVNAGTVSSIYGLKEEECVMELARMLGGAEITEKVIESAREMKELAKRK